MVLLSNVFLTLVGILYKIIVGRMISWHITILVSNSQQTFRRLLAHFKNQARSTRHRDIDASRCSGSNRFETRFDFEPAIIHVHGINNCSNFFLHARKFVTGRYSVLINKRFKFHRDLWFWRNDLSAISIPLKRLVQMNSKFDFKSAITHTG